LIASLVLIPTFKNSVVKNGGIFSYHLRLDKSSEM